MEALSFMYDHKEGWSSSPYNQHLDETLVFAP